MLNPATPVLEMRRLASLLQVGDLLFTRVDRTPFRQVAQATGSWTNHVGIVAESGPGGVIVAESRVPLSRCTPLAGFVGRSADGRVAVLRLPQPLSQDQTRRLRRAIDCRLNRLYDTGFNLLSRRQFCSRFVREVLEEATGTALGEVATFRELLQGNPGADLRLWRIWYFGRIPWERRTVTPASLYRSPALQVMFDGAVSDQRSNGAKPL